MARQALTQDALAERVDAGQSTIWSWLKGNVPKRQSMQTLAGALGVRPEWLRDGTGQREAEAEPPQDDAARLRREVAALTNRIQRAAALTGRIHRANVEIQRCAEALQRAVGAPAKKPRKKHSAPAR